MNIVLRLAVPILILICYLPRPAEAQVDPRQILLVATHSAQTGNVMPFGPMVRNVIAMQTGGTGVYPQLVGLGPVAGVTVVAMQPLPLGAVIQGRVFHQNGFSDWTVAYAYSTNTIENASFQFAPYNWGGPAPTGGPPINTPSGPAPTGPAPTTPPPPASTGDGCAKYPTLC